MIHSELRKSYVSDHELMEMPNKVNGQFHPITAQRFMPQGYGNRLIQARLAAGAQLVPARIVSQGLMADMVTAELKRLGANRSVSQSVWSDYEAEKSEPSLIVFQAASNVSGLPQSFLAFGEGRDDQLIDPARDRKLSQAEEQRALRASDDRRKAATAPPPKAKKRGAGGGR